MSFWTDIRDTWEKVSSLGAYDPVESHRQEKEQREMINNQIKAYKEQTELTRQQLNETRSQMDADKRRVQEKQIRSLRRNFRPMGSGFLGVGASSTQDMTNTLGG